MNQDEVESQLSAMFDGELPAAECELLSRRIDRDENLRARWARYALIGAAMRSEPVATARSGFAQRVSQAIDRGGETPQRPRRGRRLMLSTALAATLVAAVAGLSVSLLRDVALRGSPLAAGAEPAQRPTNLQAPAQGAATGQRSPDAGTMEVRVAEVQGSGHGPLSYVTPAGTTNAATMLRTQLADYIVAHSVFSPPLLRRNVWSELVTSEDQMGIASSYPGAARTDAIRPTSDSSR